MKIIWIIESPLHYVYVQTIMVAVLFPASRLPFQNPFLFVGENTMVCIVQWQIIIQEVQYNIQKRYNTGVYVCVFTSVHLLNIYMGVSSDLHKDPNSILSFRSL